MEERKVERTTTPEFILALDSITGSVYGIRIAAELLSRGYAIRLILADACKEAYKEVGSEIETWINEFKSRYDKNFYVYTNDDIDKQSEIFLHGIKGIIIMPCAMKTLHNIAVNKKTNFIESSAIECLNENREMLVVPRETPLNEEHLTDMLSITKRGANIVPNMPPFPRKLVNLEDMIDYMVSIIFEVLNIE